MSEKGSPVPPSDRRARIEAILRETLRRRHAGEALSDEQVIAAHGELMPDLARGLQKLRVVADARKRADARSKHERAGAPGGAVVSVKGGGVGGSRTTALPPDAEGDVAGEWSTIPAGLVIPGYSLVRKISQGGQAFVYQAIQESTGRKVAVKVMREGPMASPRERARFEREVQILATIHHPGIVEVLDRGVAADGSYFLVMEYVLGQPLDAFLDDYRRQHGDDADPGELLRLFLKICDAVNAAHLRGIVHRDLKPSNIRIDPDGEPHVLDFGLARTAVTSMTDETNPQPVTITGQFIGSLPWASPEQADGIASRIDTRSDVYSLGVILYQMLTGQFPYEVVGTMRDVLNNILHAEPTPPTKLLAAREAKELEKGKRRRRRHGVAINGEIEAVVLKALSKSRDSRYQTAGDLARDLTNYLSGRPTEAAGSRPRAGFTFPRINRRIVALGAAAAIVFIACFLGALWWPAQPRRAAQAPPVSPSGSVPTGASRDGGAMAGEASAVNAVVTSATASPPIVDNVAPAAQVASSPVARETPLVLDLGGGVTMEFEYIPAGTFVMGTGGRIAEELPRHTVTLTKPFYLSKTEVTSAQWNAVTGENRQAPSQDVPVTASWFDCQAFARKLKAKHPGVEPRLPTEAEWEYACRAGTTGEYPGGDDPWSLEEYVSQGENGVHRVARMKPNAWGLYDMHGSLAEWTADWYGPYAAAAVTNPTGPTSGKERVVRGTGASGLPTAAARGKAEPSFHSTSLGFRVALDVPATAATQPAPQPASIHPAPPTERGAQDKPLGGAAASDADASPQATAGAASAAPASPTPDDLGSQPASAAVPTPVKLPQRTIDLGGGVKMEFVLIPAGSFNMGFPSQHVGNPVHRVNISKPFWMGKYEVTHAQWLALMDDRRIQSKGQLPVEHAQWIDIQAYLRRLNARDGSLKARLPTEAEWEYACRAGGNTTFYYGDDPWELGEYAWYVRNAGGKTHPVGQKRPNAWGLYDMHGNAWEICSDWAGPYPEGEVTDPVGADKADSRASRGGHWNDDDGVVNCGYRGGIIPGTNTGGFRLVLEASRPDVARFAR